MTKLGYRLDIIQGMRGIFYPVMARKHEMICTKTPVPVWVSSRNEIDIIQDSPSQGFHITVFSVVNVLNHPYYTEWKEEHMSSVRISRSLPAFHFHGVYKKSLRGIYTPAGAIMKYWWFTFFVNIYLERLLHFQVTPAMSPKDKRN